MTDNKFIIRALAHCVNKTDVFVRYRDGDDHITEITIADILGVITCQKAEIERLNKQNLSVVKHLKRARKQIKDANSEIERLYTENCELITKIKQNRINFAERVQLVENGRKRGIQEFAERLKKSVASYDEYEVFYSDISAEEVDDLVKEMVGDDQ